MHISILNQEGIKKNKRRDYESVADGPRRLLKKPSQILSSEIKDCGMSISAS